MANFKIVEEKLKELFPKRIDRAKFLGVEANDCARKVKTFENKIEWLETNCKRLGLTIKIEGNGKS